MREELLELGVELGGERFVVRHDEGRALNRLDHVGHGERFAGAGHAHERLNFFTGTKPRHQLRDRLRLVARGLKRRNELKIHFTNEE